MPNLATHFITLKRRHTLVIYLQIFCGPQPRESCFLRCNWLILKSNPATINHIQIRAQLIWKLKKSPPPHNVTLR